MKKIKIAVLLAIFSLSSAPAWGQTDAQLRELGLKRTPDGVIKSLNEVDPKKFGGSDGSPRSEEMGQSMRTNSTISPPISESKPKP